MKVYMNLLHTFQDIWLVVGYAMKREIHTHVCLHRLFVMLCYTSYSLLERGYIKGLILLYIQILINGIKFSSRFWIVTVYVSINLWRCFRRSRQQKKCWWHTCSWKYEQAQLLFQMYVQRVYIAHRAIPMITFPRVQIIYIYKFVATYTIMHCIHS